MVSRRVRATAMFLLVSVLVTGAVGVAGAAPVRGVDEADAGPTATATTAPAVTPLSAPTATALPPIDDHTRPKPSPRAFENPAAQPEPTATPTPPPTPEPTPTGPPRLDHPVLRWLPEILNASAATGVAPELIAAIMQVESQGNPNIISPAGARGLMQVMPGNLLAMGFPEGSWHDPASNILAGAIYVSGSGVAAYFGFGCDVFGTCTDVYVSVVYGWSAYYAPIIANPSGSGFAILGPDWAPPPIAPFVEAAPAPIPTPPPDTPTPVPSATATPEPGATTTPTAPATATAEPTAPPTAAPTEPPTAIPTEPPTVVPTEPPTEVPTEPPPPPPPTEPPPQPPPQPPPEPPPPTPEG